MYYDRETSVKINQLVNDFYTCSLFRIDAFTQYEMFLLDIAATFFNSLSYYFRELFLEEGVQVSIIQPEKKIYCKT